MLYIKDNFPTDRYEDQFEELWLSYWRDSMDISKPEIMKECLVRHFSNDETTQIIEGGTSPRYKKMLTEETAKLVERGAFGAPWFFVTNKGGKQEPFFGSDRYALDVWCSHHQTDDSADFISCCSTWNCRSQI